MPAVVAVWMIAAILPAASNGQADARRHDLDFYLSNGVRNNPGLIEYGNELQSASLDSARTHAGFLPQVALNSVNQYAPIVRDYGYDEAVTNRGQISALLSFSQGIVFSGNRESQYRALRVQAEATDNERRVATLTLEKNIIAQYLTAFGLSRQCKLLDELIGLMQAEERILRQLTESGVYKQTDYLAFEIGRRQQELQRRQVAAQFQDNLATLNGLCGIVDTSAVELVEPSIAIALPPDLTDSPLLRQFALDSLRLSIQSNQIDAAYHPKINLLADLGYLSSILSMSGYAFGGSVGLSVSLPLYDGGQRGMQHEQVMLSEQTRRAYRDFFVAQSRQQRAQWLQQLRAADDLSRQARDQEAAANVLVDAYRKLLPTGDLRIADYLLALASSLTARMSTAQYDTNRLLIINQLNYWSRTR
jgi:outer membrane protein TolC